MEKHVNKLIIMIGIPGCGKSTYAQAMEDANTVVISSDIIRKELLGDEQDQNNNALVFSTLYAKSREFLKKGKDVVIDATNINTFERKRVLDNFKDLNIKRIALVIDTDIKICIERDSLRARHVGEDIILGYANKYEAPTKAEGFDEIVIIKNV